MITLIFLHSGFVVNTKFDLIVYTEIKSLLLLSRAF